MGTPPNPTLVERLLLSPLQLSLEEIKKSETKTKGRVGSDGRDPVLLMRHWTQKLSCSNRDLQPRFLKAHFQEEDSDLISNLEHKMCPFHSQSHPSQSRDFWNLSQK